MIVPCKDFYTFDTEYDNQLCYADYKNGALDPIQYAVVSSLVCGGNTHGGSEDSPYFGCQLTGDVVSDEHTQLYSFGLNMPSLVQTLTGAVPILVVLVVFVFGFHIVKNALSSASRGKSRV